MNARCGGVIRAVHWVGRQVIGLRPPHEVASNARLEAVLVDIGRIVVGVVGDSLFAYKIRGCGFKSDYRLTDAWIDCRTDQCCTGDPSILYSPQNSAAITVKEFRLKLTSFSRVRQVELACGRVAK